jgi:hypothetical protein
VQSSAETYRSTFSFNVGAAAVYMPGRQQEGAERVRYYYLRPSDALDVVMGRLLWLRLGVRQSRQEARGSWGCKLLGVS